ncbi:MAG: protein kinase domain-containing protein [Polyangiales bacterium]
MSGSQQFGHYELLDRVNVGGMAEIFRARDTQSGQVCAIKRILPEIADDEEFVRMFRDEAKVVGLLEHPNICRVLDLGRSNDTYFLALEFVEGFDLRAIFDRAAKQGIRLELPFVLHVFMKVCEGLEYAHRKRDPQGRHLSLVHRDVSPQNVLVSFAGEVKLIDFGIAKSNGKLSKTQVGTIKGKYGYMSPEQVRGLPLDGRSDLFSLGICMWEMLTRKRLFSADNEMLILERIKEADVTPPKRIDPTVPEAVQQMVLRALSRDVNDRYPSAADLYADLQAFAFSEGLVWGKEAVAEYMQRTFGSGAAKPSPTARGLNGALNEHSSPGGPHARVQEQKMSDNKGSDLDVFEGLTSKRGNAPPPRTSGAPPPPPASRSVPPPPPPRSRAATQMGMGLPPMPSHPRTSTPPIAPPPSRQNTGAQQAVPLPPPPSMRGAPPPPSPPPPGPPPPSAQARGAMVDMDWDDEDEKTHVYDKDIVQQEMRRSTSNMPAPLPPPAPPPAAGSPVLKSTMVGMAQPLPPPPRSSDRPLPPPPPSRSKPPSIGGMGAAPPPPPPPAPPPPQVLPPMNVMHGVPVPPPPAHPPAAAMTAPMVQPVPAPAPQPAPMAPPARPVDATQVIRPKSGSSVGLIIGGLVVAAAAGVGGFFWMSSRPGNVLVNVEVKGPKGTAVKVSLDGQEKCSDSTCRIEGVSPGAHTVKAIAGDVEKKATLQVEPGKDAIANLSLEVAAKSTGVKLASSQTGLKVEIDGGSPRALPVDDDSLKPGEHTLKFTGPGSRYGTKEMKVTLEEGQMKAIEDVKLPLKSVKAKFAVATKGAKAFLDDGSIKKTEIKDGDALELDTTKSYTVTATAPNMEDYSKKVEFGDDAEQAIKIELSEKGKPAPAAPPPAAPVVAVGPKPVPGPAAPPPAPPEPAAGGDGKLLVNTLPPSACMVDGAPKGKTPFTISIAPGSHTVKCTAKDGDDVLQKSTTVTVKAGDTAKAIMKLRD